MKNEITYFTANAKILKQESVMDVINEIVKQPGKEEPFYILDVGDIVKKIKVWKLKLPRVRPFYAVKCNDNITVLETLSSLGTGFDCASKGELQKVIDLGVNPSDIIYAHPCKPISHIRHAERLNVQMMTFDNEAELFKVKKCFPEAKLVIRIRCDAVSAQCPLGVKFGVLPENAPALLKTAWDLGLNVIGVSFHVGSGCREPEVFLRAISASREVFDTATSLGFEPYLLDIGGGFPGTPDSNLDELAFYINTALDRHFPEDCGVEVIAEPGRYVVASAFTLATMVVSRREVTNDAGDLESIMYYINDGVYGSFNCVLYDHQEVTPLVLKDAKDEKHVSSSIWGPTCDGLDQVLSSVKLPELHLGDWIIWENMGAYTIAAANTFNGFPIPSVKVVVPLHTWLFLENCLASALLDEDKTELSDGCVKDLAMLQQCTMHEEASVNNFLAGITLVDG